MDDHKKSANETTDNADDEFQAFRTFFKDWQRGDIIQGLILVVGAIYCAVTIGLWCSTLEANRLARQSIANADRNFRADERAWVGALEAEPVENVEVGGHPRFGIIVTNSGKSPALDFRYKIYSEAYRRGYNFTPHYPDASPLPENSVDVLQPGAKVYLRTLPVMDISQSDLDSYRNGSYVIRYYATIFYKDIFDSQHTTTICDFVETDLKTSGACNGYNDAN